MQLRTWRLLESTVGPGKPLTPPEHFPQEAQHVREELSGTESSLRKRHLPRIDGRGVMWQIDVTSKMILQESGEHRNTMKYFHSFQRMETKNGRFNFGMADLQNFSHLFLELCLGKNPGVRQQMLKRSRDRSWKPSYERCEGFCSWDFQPTLDDTSRTGRSLWTEIPPKPTLFSINER